MVKFKSILKWLFIALILAFIYFPIVFLTINSFNESDMIQEWSGFSFDHYKYFFNLDNEPLRVVLQTLLLAVVVALLSTVLGTIGSIGIFYSGKRTGATLSAVNRIPIINADVVTAISFALLISFLGVDKSTYLPLIFGQMLLCTPFVIFDYSKAQTNG